MVGYSDSSSSSLSIYFLSPKRYRVSTANLHIWSGARIYRSTVLISISTCSTFSSRMKCRPGDDLSISYRSSSLCTHIPHVRWQTRSQLLFSPYMEPSSAQWIFVSLSLFIRSEYIESMQANEGKDVDLQPGLMYKSPLLCYADAHSTRRWIKSFLRSSQRERSISLAKKGPAALKLPL